MPYTTTWVPPELFMTHNGVNVFHTYKDDDIDQGARMYWYTLNTQDNDTQHFDVRNLDTDRLLYQHPPYLQGEYDTPENREAWGRWRETGEPDLIRQIIAAALDAGMIPLPEDMADNIVSADDA